jgi:hypothetical protein
MCLNCKKQKQSLNSPSESGVFTNLPALMGLQQHHARQQQDIYIRYKNNLPLDDDRVLQYEASPPRYPNIATQPDRLLERLQNMQEQMDLLKERNMLLEKDPKRNYPSAPSVQNPNMF